MKANQFISFIGSAMADLPEDTETLAECENIGSIIIRAGLLAEGAKQHEGQVLDWLIETAHVYAANLKAQVKKDDRKAAITTYLREAFIKKAEASPERDHVTATDSKLEFGTFDVLKKTKTNPNGKIVPGANLRPYIAHLATVFEGKYRAGIKAVTNSTTLVAASKKIREAGKAKTITSGINETLLPEGYKWAKSFDELPTDVLVQITALAEALASYREPLKKAAS